MQYVPHTCGTATHRWQKYSVLSQEPSIVGVIVVNSANSLHGNQDELDYAIFPYTNRLSGVTID